MLSSLFAPRGLELYVPALAALREELWARLDPELRLALEIADYLGLERAAALTTAETNEVAGVLPGHLWNALAQRKDVREIFFEFGPGFVDRIGKALSVDQVN